MIEDRQATRNKADNQPWYSGVDERGEHSATIVGEAGRQINNQAQMQGVSPGAMTRAVALTSPQSAWDKGVPGGHEHRFPNLTHAASATKAVDSAGAHSRLTEAKELGQAVSTSDGGLPEMGAKAAGDHYTHGNDASAPIRVRSALSAKAANFLGSLHQSDAEPAAQRMAATTWTADRHDERAAGIDNPTGDGLLNQRKGVYDVAAMTGVRTAHANRTRSSDEQAREWVGQRGTNQHESDHDGLFMHGTDRKGNIQVNPNAPWSDTPTQPRISSRNLQRRADGSLVPDDISPF
jgi:hypothetical protein